MELTPGGSWPVPVHGWTPVLHTGIPHTAQGS